MKMSRRIQVITKGPKEIKRARKYVHTAKKAKEIRAKK